MIDKNQMKKIARARLGDAQVLLDYKRYEGAIYVCGYAVELALKVRICKTLKWTSFPTSRNEFSNYRSFKTHNLDVLLHLCGIENRIKTELLAEWSAVAQWDPEARYKPIGSANKSDATLMIDATETLLRTL
ncbi:MAG: HEPN domain-containing protein [Thermoleophilia bacterium]